MPLIIGKGTLVAIERGLSFFISSVHKQINLNTTTSANCNGDSTAITTTSSTTNCSCSSSWHYAQLKKSILRNKNLLCSCRSQSLLPSFFNKFSFSNTKSVLNIDLHYCLYLLRNSVSIFIHEIRQNKRGKANFTINSEMFSVNY